MKSYVIIGNGDAAINCIEGIRSTDKDGKIYIVSRENRPAYCRPLISYYLEGRASADKMNLRDDDFYAKNGCEVLYGKTALKLNSEGKRVTLDDLSELNYDELCICAGSSPFVPPFEGLDSVSNKFGFMTLDDALNLENAISKSSKVLIVGAGLIGLKCAEGILDRVAGVTVCDLADRVLSSILDADGAKIIQTALESHGVKFMLSDSVTRFDKSIACMKSGAKVEFDVLVLAVGVRASISLIQDIGGDTGRGIIVDSHMRTSIPHIYAAGDCAQSIDLSDGKSKVMAIMPMAALQGFTAGQNMAGGNVSFEKGIPMNSIGFFGTHAMTAGSYEGDVYEEKTDTTLKRLYVRDNRLVGFMLIGLNERAGIYTSLIREQTNLNEINFELIKKTASTLAFSRESRGKKFGEVV